MTSKLDCVQQLIDIECNEIRNLLIVKNRRYGNAAVEPIRLFSKANATEQIKVRIDDKLSRLANRQDDEDEDVTLDLIGYLILLRVAERYRKQREAAEEGAIRVTL